MPRAAKFVNLLESQLVEQAIANLSAMRDPTDNYLPSVEVIAEINRLQSFNAAAERIAKAERIFRNHQRPRKTPSVGSLWLPGFEPVPYEPSRLMVNGENVVERDLAPPSFIEPSVTKLENHLTKVQNAYNRELRTLDEFAEWAADQAIKGRPHNEITFGNCMREKAYWSSESVDSDDAEDDE